MDQQKPEPNANDDHEEVQGNLSHDLPEWLQEFRHGLVDESVPEHRDASSSFQEWVITAFLLTSRRTGIAISA